MRGFLVLVALLWGLALVGAAGRPDKKEGEDDESKHRHPLGDAIYIADADTVSGLLENRDIHDVRLGPIAPHHKVYGGQAVVPWITHSPLAVFARITSVESQ